MIASRRWFVARGRALLGALLGLGLPFILGSCQADTLYPSGTPSGNGQGPTLVIASPATGSAVQAGHPVPVEIVASDAAGVSQIVLTASGAVQQTITKTYSPPRDSVVLDTVVSVPAGASGSVQLRAHATNASGGTSDYGPVALAVSSSDVVPPTVSMTVTSTPRMERTDSFIVRVHGTDNPGGSGVAKLGYTLLITNPRLAQTEAVTDSVRLAHPVPDTTMRFAFPDTALTSPLHLPDSLSVEVHAFAVDSAGQCGAAVDAGGSVGCEVATIGGRQVRVAGKPAPALGILVVAGRTSLIPGGGSVFDLLVGATQLPDRVYISNFDQNRVQVLQPSSATWQGSAKVGSEPWGLAWDRTGDTIFVANSGGTSISKLVVAGGSVSEDSTFRFNSQDASLFELKTSGQDSVAFRELSERPEFVAEDARGELLYSTLPTPGATDGSIHVVTRGLGWQTYESKLLVRPEDIVPFDGCTEPSGLPCSGNTGPDGDIAVAHIDSIVSYYSANPARRDSTKMFDHKPGFPTQIISGKLSPTSPDTTLLKTFQAQGSDVLWGYGSWHVEQVFFGDTTFVAASGDRQWIAIGEGAGDNGRIVMWSSQDSAISHRLPVADLVANTSEHVTGVALNADGSLGVVHTDGGLYFFDRELRLQGMYMQGLIGAAGGVTLYNLSGWGTLAFVGTAEHTVRIVDTSHFTTVGNIAIRDDIVGPLKAGPVLPTDNNGAGASCIGQDCVVMKLYAVTSAGGVDVIDVHASDISDP